VQSNPVPRFVCTFAEAKPGLVGEARLVPKPGLVAKPGLVPTYAAS
jgi:hypothetical protein